MDETVHANVRFRWLVVPALCLLVAGLVLGYQHRRAYYTGLLILAGCLVLAAVLLANHDR